MAGQTSLRLVCSHGAALFYIAQHPDCTISDLAEALVVTRRTDSWARTIGALITSRVFARRIAARPVDTGPPRGTIAAP